MLLLGQFYGMIAEIYDELFLYKVYSPEKDFCKRIIEDGGKV